MEIQLVALGESRTVILPLPGSFKVQVLRDDGFAPTPPEIYAALQLALDIVAPKKKKKLPSN